MMWRLALGAGLAATLGAADGVLVVATPAPAALWAAFPARIDNRAQLGHAPSIPWMNVGWLADEGATVAIGDPLIRLDTTWPKKWEADRVSAVRQATADWERAALDSANRLAELDQRRRELQDAVPALRAALIAAAARDESRIAQARLRHERCADDAQRLAHRATAATALAAAGRMPTSEAEAAQTAATTAQLAARAAAYRLAIEEDPEPGLSAIQAQLRYDRLLAALGDDQHGLEREIIEARNREVAEMEMAADPKNNSVAGLERLQAALHDPTVRATVAGSVKLRNEQVKPGAKLSATTALFVCGSGEQVAGFGLPEELRGLVVPWSEQHPEAGQAEVEILGANGPYRIPGRLISIGAAPEIRPDGRRAFPALIGLGAAGDAMRLGMPATVHLRVRAPEGSLQVPTFCLGWAGRPMMLGPQGAIPVEAVPVGSTTLVLAGLKPGDQILPWDPKAAGQSPARRLSGVLEAWERAPVRLRTTEWDILDIAPDGSLVAAGAVVARMVRNVWWIDAWSIRRNVLAGRTRAALRRNQSRADAVMGLVRAEVSRRQVEIDTVLARFALLIAEAPPVAEDQAAAQGAALAAESLARRAAEAVPGADEARPDLSLGARTALVANAGQAAISAQRAAIAAIVTTRNTGLVAALVAREKARIAREQGDRARGDWLLARAVYLRQMSGSAATIRHFLREIRNQRENLEGEVLRAPATGRIHHRPGKPYRVGNAIDTLEPLYVPIGNARKLIFEIPSSAVAHFSAGSTVPVNIPGLGQTPRPATVIACGTRYGSPTDAGDAVTGDQVADLVLRLDLSPADADRAGPGMTAYVDL